MIYKIDFGRIGRPTTCAAGTTILDAAREAGVSLNSICGGMKKCGRCKVRVLSGTVSPLTKSETVLLNETEIAGGLRLACAARVMSDLKVDIPATSIADNQSLQLTGKEPHFTIDPVVTRYQLDVSTPTLDRPSADWENVCKTLSKGYGLRGLRQDLFALRNIPTVLRRSKWQVEVIVRDDEVIGIRHRQLKQRALGVAIDLGTTKIAALLVDLETGKTLAAMGAMNPQIPYGDDVMNRISYANDGGLNKLRQVVIGGLNNLIREISVNPNAVLETVIVGNTAMHHLFLGLPVRQLGRTPYVPAVRCSLDVKARDLGLKMAKGAYVHVLPNIGGFVGADHVAMILAGGLHETGKTVLGVDIGTNTEIALAVGGKISSVSCASGAAFEGAAIQHGMRATEGAIQGVKTGSEGICLDVIGGASPAGICGSGILDVFYQLRQQQIVDRRGRLQNSPGVRHGVSGLEFVLAQGNKDGPGEDIVVTQRDLGEVQLAKAAIRAGINILLAEAGIKANQIDEVMIAGAFGSHIDVASAVGIGMLPAIPLKRFTQVGNLAGVGAKLCLVSKKNRIFAEEIASHVRYIELTTHHNYSKEFSHSLLLP